METELQQLRQQAQDFQDKVNHLSDLFYKTFLIDKVLFNDPIYFKDGMVVSLTGTVGTQFGNTGEKIGFLGHAPVARQSAITTPSGGATQDAESRTAIGQIKTVLTNLGLTS